MKIHSAHTKSPRVEMLPLIDIVFLLLVVFIYAMLSMAVHRGVPVLLPTSSQAAPDGQDAVSVTIKADGTVFVDQTAVTLADLSAALTQKPAAEKDRGVLLFADRNLPYQTLYDALDQIQKAGLTRVSLQAEGERQP